MILRIFLKNDDSAAAFEGILPKICPHSVYYKYNNDTSTTQHISIKVQPK